MAEEYTQTSNWHLVAQKNIQTFSQKKKKKNIETGSYVIINQKINSFYLYKNVND